MQINFQELRTIMKSSQMKVYRDGAPVDATYPYIVYQFVNEQYKRASNEVMKDMPLYQISVVTDGTEAHIEPLKNVLKANKVLFEPFIFGPYAAENDETVTQYITYVRCVN